MHCIPNGYDCIPDCWKPDHCCGDVECQPGGTCEGGTCRCRDGWKRCGRGCVAVDGDGCCDASDCASRVCVAAVQRCAQPTCADGVQNGMESDVDCGGGGCPTCAAGRRCGGGSDCRSNVCSALKCVDAGFAATSYGGGTHPVWVTSGDFNGDRRPDIATANASGNASILLGRGDGSFKSIGSFGAGVSPVMITNGDLNGDSRPDLVVVNQGSYDITVLLGNGDGTFAPGVSYGVGATPTWATIADVNGDRRLDVVVANSISNTISVLIGHGDGKFNAKVDYPTDIDPRAVEACDLNGDALADLVVACRDGSRISILMNKSFAGLLGFNAHTSTVWTIGPNALAIADLNGDKKLDVIAGSTGSGSQVFLGGGNGQIVLAGAIGSGVDNQLIPIDVNNDKILDVVTTNGALRGNGNGSFREQVGFPDYRDLASLAIADFTADRKDGQLDIAFPQPQDGTIVSLWGNGDGTFQALNAAMGMVSGSTTDVKLLQPAALALRDLNGDGRDDVLAASSAPAQLWVWLVNRDGSLQLPARYPIAPGASAIAAGDFDQDGSPDVIVGSAAGSPTLLLGSRSGLLTPVVPVNGMPPAIHAENASAMQGADVDKDGHLDLVFSDANMTHVLFGRGDGTFRNNDSPLATSGRSNARTLQLVDWDGDGYLDLVSTNVASCGVSLSKGGDGRGGFLGFGAAVEVPLAGGMKASAAWAADINGDRALDVVVSGSNQVFVYMNANVGMGNLLFKVGLGYPVAAAPSSMVMADLDGDQLLDVATANTLDRSVSTLSGRKDGTFDRLASHDVGDRPALIATGDVNGDGKPDLVTADANTVTVLLNQR